jgi:homoserine O-succinyltransferase
MPVMIPNALPAATTLTNENIFVMTHMRATSQDIRPLEIAILNLMPTKETTETQLLRLVGNTSLQVQPVLLRTASYTPSHTRSQHLDAFYRTFEEIKGRKFDGLIVTGAPVEQMKFEDVAYWEELTEIFDWANENVFSTLYICWAAQAALYYNYGIEKHTLARKLFGVYRHKVMVKNCRLLRGFDDYFSAPHSRHTAIEREDILGCEGLEVLAESEEAGVYLAASKDGRQVFVTGHSEYDGDTLDQEYRRDLAKGLEIAPPVNYYPGGDTTAAPMVTWRAHGNLLFGNWLNYYVYQETPYDINAIAPNGGRKAK